MAFNDIERKRIEKKLHAFIEDIRPELHIRPQLDFGFDILGQSIELVEIRPEWKNPSVIHRRAFAKATFVRTQNCWKVYWMRASGKWNGYEPVALVRTVDEFLAVIKADQYGCFFG
jgi:Protein of unknown function (DUF3024)